MTTSTPDPRGGWMPALGWTSLSQVATIVGGVTGTVLGARVLSPEDFAAIGFAITAAGFLTMAGSLGLGPAIIAHASRASGRPRPEVVAGQLAAALLCSLLVAVGWSAVVGPVVAPDGTGRPLVVATLLLALAGLASTAADAAARAGRHFRLAAFVGPAVRRVAVVGVLALVAPRGTSAAALIGIVALVEAVVGVAGLLRALGAAPMPSNAPLGPALRRGSVFVTPTIVSVLVPQGVVWLAAASTTDLELGRLFVATQLGLLFSVPKVVGGRVIGPMVAASDTADLRALEAPARRVANLSVLLGVVGLVGLWLLGPIVLPQVFGPVGEDVTILAVLIGAGQIGSIAVGLAGQVLPNAGLQVRYARANALAVIAYAVLVPIVAAGAGVVALAVVAAVVPLVLHLWMALEASRRLDLRLWVGRARPQRAAGPASIAFFDVRHDEVYGAQENMLLLAEQVQAAGHPVLVPVTAEGRLADSARERGLPVVVVPAPEPLRRFEGGVFRGGVLGRLRVAVALLTYNRDFANEMRRQRVDVVFACAVRPALSLMWTRRITRIPVVLFAQNSIPLGRFAALAAGTADRIGLIGEGARPTFPERTRRRHADRFRPLPSGRSFDAYPIGPMRPTAATAPLQVTTVCSVTERKGVHHLLDAVAELRAEGLDLHLTVVGGTNGEASEAYRAQLLDTALDANVPLTITGFRDDVVPYLHRTDLMVLASADEGLPGVLLEAMATGRACVTTRAGSAGELVERCGAGMAVDVGDQAALVAAMRALLVDPGRRLDHARRGADAVRRHYSLTAFRDHFFRILDELVEPAPTATRSPSEEVLTS